MSFYFNLCAMDPNARPNRRPFWRRGIGVCQSPASGEDNKAPPRFSTISIFCPPAYYIVPWARENEKSQVVHVVGQSGQLKA